MSSARHGLALYTATSFPPTIPLVPDSAVVTPADPEKKLPAVMITRRLSDLSAALPLYQDQVSQAAAGNRGRTSIADHPVVLLSTRVPGAAAPSAIYATFPDCFQPAFEVDPQGEGRAAAVHGVDELRGVADRLLQLAGGRAFSSYHQILFPPLDAASSPPRPQDDDFIYNLVLDVDAPIANPPATPYKSADDLLQQVLYAIDAQLDPHRIPNTAAASAGGASNNNSHRVMILTGNPSSERDVHHHRRRYSFHVYILFGTAPRTMPSSSTKTTTKTTQELPIGFKSPAAVRSFARMMNRTLRCNVVDLHPLRASGSLRLPYASRFDEGAAVESHADEEGSSSPSFSGTVARSMLQPYVPSDPFLRRRVEWMAELPRRDILVHSLLSRRRRRSSCGTVVVWLGEEDLQRRGASATATESHPPAIPADEALRRMAKLLALEAPDTFAEPYVVWSRVAFLLAIVCWHAPALTQDAEYIYHRYAARCPDKYTAHETSRTFRKCLRSLERKWGEGSKREHPQPHPQVRVSSSTSSSMKPMEPAAAVRSLERLLAHFQRPQYDDLGARPPKSSTSGTTNRGIRALDADAADADGWDL